MFLGYQEGTKGYILWERKFERVKIIVSRDFISNEYVFSCKTNINIGISMKTPTYFNSIKDTPIEVEHQPNPPDFSNDNQAPTLVFKIVLDPVVN